MTFSLRRRFQPVISISVIVNLREPSFEALSHLRAKCCRGRCPRCCWPSTCTVYCTICTAMYCTVLHLYCPTLDSPMLRMVRLCRPALTGEQLWSNMPQKLFFKKFNLILITYLWCSSSPGVLLSRVTPSLVQVTSGRGTPSTCIIIMIKRLHLDNYNDDKG